LAADGLVPTADDLAAAVRAAFDGLDAAQDPQKLRFLVTCAAEVRREWLRARESFLSIGRALADAEQQLSEPEFKRLLERSQEVLGVSRSVIAMIRGATAAVIDGRIPEPDCPPAYSIAYQLATLPPEALEVAKKRRLVRVDVSRTEVIQFKAEVSQRRTAEARVNSMSVADMRREERALTAKLRRAWDEAKPDVRRLRELRRALKDVYR
jgi:hypothetical protein